MKHNEAILFEKVALVSYFEKILKTTVDVHVTEAHAADLALLSDIKTVLQRVEPVPSVSSSSSSSSSSAAVNAIIKRNNKVRVEAMKLIKTQQRKIERFQKKMVKQVKVEKQAVKVRDQNQISVLFDTSSDNEEDQQASSSSGNKSISSNSSDSDNDNEVTASSSSGSKWWWIPFLLF